MNVALCFSGQTRNVEYTYHNHIKPNVLDANPHCHFDVFVHTWYHPSTKGVPLTTAVGGPASNPIPHNILDVIYECYNPVCATFQHQMPFDEKNYATNKYQFINVFYSLSKMYSGMRSVLSAQRYADEAGIKYDLLISGRFDWGFNGPLALDSPQENTVYYCGGNPHGVNVGWVWGDPIAVAQYSCLFYSVERLFNNGVPFCDEILAQAFLDEEKIQYVGIGTSYSIIRIH